MSGHRRAMSAAAGLVLGLLAAEAALAQAIYRWVDETGKVQYSDQKPLIDSARAAASLSAAERLMRNSRRNTTGAAKDWARSASRFAPRATTPREVLPAVGDR